MAATDLLEAMAGVQDVRRVVVRWELSATLTLDTPTCLMGEDGVADHSVLEDPTTGEPFLPGSTIAGVLRHHLADWVSGYVPRADDPPEVKRLFGDSDAGQSPLIVHHGLLLHGDRAGRVLRAAVALNPATGTLGPGSLFDTELVAEGTQFRIAFDLLIGDPDDEQPLLELLVTALEGLVPAPIETEMDEELERLEEVRHATSARLGVRTSRGYGKVSASEWRAERFDLSDPIGWGRWLRSRPAHRLAGSGGVDVARSAVAAELTRTGSQLTLSRPPDQRHIAVLRVPLVCRGPLLSRVYRFGPGDADVAHHTNAAAQPMLAGTGTAGALLQHARRILSVLTAGDRRGREARLRDLFGGSGTGRGDPPSPSRVRVEEIVTADEQLPLRLTRLPLDRFTGGGLEGLLVDEEVEDGGTFTLIVGARAPRPADIGLLALLGRDIAEGHVALGGTVGIGRGAVRGGAPIELIEYRGGKATPLDVSADSKTMAECVGELVASCGAA